jgi:hypothetical protein
MITVRYNNQPIVWDEKVELKPGANTLVLELKNGVPLK